MYSSRSDSRSLQVRSQELNGLTVKSQRARGCRSEPGAPQPTVQLTSPLQTAGTRRTTDCCTGVRLKALQAACQIQGGPQTTGQTPSSAGCRSDPRKSTDYRSDSELYRLQVRYQEVHRMQVRLRALQAAGQSSGGPQTTGRTQTSTDYRSDPRWSTDYKSDSELYRLQVRSQEEVHRLQVRHRTLQTAGQILGGPQPTGQTQSSTGCRSDPRRRSTGCRSDRELYRLQVRF